MFKGCVTFNNSLRFNEHYISFLRQRLREYHLVTSVQKKEAFSCQRGNQGAFFADKEKVEEFKHEK